MFKYIQGLATWIKATFISIIFIIFYIIVSFIYELSVLYTFEETLWWFETYSGGLVAIRNGMLSIGALFIILGAFFAAWRTIIANKDHKLDTKKHDAEQFNKAFEQLGNSSPHVRVAALLLLWKGVEEGVIEKQSFLLIFDEYLVSISSKMGPLIDGEVDDRTRQIRREAKTETRSILQFYKNKIGSKDNSKRIFEINQQSSYLHRWTYINLYDMNLAGVDLDYVDFEGSNLKRINFWGANLNKCNLTDTKLNEAYLNNVQLEGAFLNLADLTSAKLNGANLCRTHFVQTDLSGANFQDVENLTQGQLNQAWAFVDAPPKNLPKGLVMNNLRPRGEKEAAE